MTCPRVFQVLWTPPLFQRTWGGHKIDVPTGGVDEMFSDYYLLTMILSVLQWRHLNGGQVKLYGDRKVIDYLGRYNLLSLWDEYDGEMFDGIERHIDPSCFYSAGKFYAYLEEPAPCVQLDLDLVVWRKLEDIQNLKTVIPTVPGTSSGTVDMPPGNDVSDPGIAVGFTHWEDTQPASYWYDAPGRLTTPPGYRFGENWDWSLKAANTSLVYFADDKVKTHYAEEVIRFMHNNWVGGEFHLIKPELLFVEQRLLPMIAHACGFENSTRPFIDTTWNCVEGRFTHHDPRFGEWKYYDLDDQPAITHLWIAKQHVEKNDRFRDYYCFRLLDRILSLRPKLATDLEKIGCVRPHLRRATDGTPPLAVPLFESACPQ